MKLSRSFEALISGGRRLPELPSLRRVTFPEVKLAARLSFAGASPLLAAGRCPSLWARVAAGRTVTAMRHRARQFATGAILVAALALVAGAAVAGCATAGATAGAPATTTGPTTTGPTSTGPTTASPASAPVAGPPVSDPACVAAKNAEQTLQSRQAQDQNNETALNQDFTNFAAALSAAAQSEKRPAVAQAMTALANDYNDLVESQSGDAQLPDVSQVQKDGTAFDKACSP
jgi:hypothetical protein